jgi:hypothetical protein
MVQKIFGSFPCSPQIPRVSILFQEIYPVGATEDLPTHSVSMECALGVCRQNYEGADEGVMCADASTWEFRFTIMDEDGYLSTVMVVVGSVD